MTNIAALSTITARTETHHLDSINCTFIHRRRSEGACPSASACPPALEHCPRSRSSCRTVQTRSETVVSPLPWTRLSSSSAVDCRWSAALARAIPASSSWRSCCWMPPVPPTRSSSTCRLESGQLYLEEGTKRLTLAPSGQVPDVVPPCRRRFNLVNQRGR